MAPHHGLISSLCPQSSSPFLSLLTLEHNKTTHLVQPVHRSTYYSVSIVETNFVGNNFQIAGDWWVIRGVNCGEDPYPGGYDWYPCQHERFIYQKDTGQWINNVTYCSGKDSVCDSEFIVTVANVSLPAAGVVQHDYTDAPLAPQVSDKMFSGRINFCRPNLTKASST